MGSVWRAEHLTLHTEVAVKFVSDALIGDPGFLARFTREAVASAQIKSPHAVQIFDHGVTADGQPYIVLELLEGEDLRTRLLRERKLPLADAVKLVTQVARGLSRAHAAEIVHRDIKPGNIFLSEQDGELFVKILDFGIAKRVGDVDSNVTMTGQIIGTPHYVSPEQITRPRDADPQNDLWSLAVVAYRCLTGDLPFEGESVGAVSIAIDRAQFVPVTTSQPGLPRMLDVWFGRAFSRSPSARFGSAKELAQAFEAASRDEPIPSAPPASVAAERATRPDGPVAVDVTAPAAVFAEAPALEAPRKTDTPLTPGEPTLSQGTVTHIESTHPRRTRLYGGGLAALAIGGAITVGLLSRGDDPSSPSAATTAVSDPAPPLPPPAVTPAETAAQATSTAEDPVAPSAAKSGLAPARSAAPAASATSSKKKKKDRGF
jgi:serine/threonine protein kinase